MVSFKDSSRNSKDRSVTLLNDEKDTLDKGTTLAVRPSINSLSSSQSLSAPRLTHSSHLWAKSTQELFYPSNVTLLGTSSQVLTLQPTLDSKDARSSSFDLLSHRIITGVASWMSTSKGSSLKYVGEFSFIPNYWEWLEDVLSRNRHTLVDAKIYDAVFASLFTYDRSVNVIQAFCEFWCPETNTLHTSAGELSISLWDLRLIGGLPVYGSFYDEVVPSAQEAILLSRSCKHLFSAFHQLCLEHGGPHNVSSSKWVNFWFKGPSRYQKPPSRRTSKRTARARSSHNPSGLIDPPQERSKEGEAPFVTLKVESDVKEETYLAAFLSCWLCEFVFPGKVSNLIRPGVFKVASLMARGTRYDLAIPVLASIYQGLGEIGSSSNPSKCNPVFPAHYLYGWLAEYFDTHFTRPRSTSAPRMVRISGEGAAKTFEDKEARRLFHSTTKLEMYRLALTKDQQGILVDDGNLSNSQSEYFISQRSCYLASRRGGLHLVQPYNPHRFGRQFGFHQHIPREIKDDYRTGSLEQVIQFWRHSIKLCTKSQLATPARPSEHSVLSTREYVEWWTQIFTRSSDHPVETSPSTEKPTLKRPSELTIVLKRKIDPVPKSIVQTSPNIIPDETSVSGGTDSQRTPTYRPCQLPPSTLEKGKTMADSEDLENSKSASEQFWRRKKQKGEVDHGNQGSRMSNEVPEGICEKSPMLPYSINQNDMVSIHSPTSIIDYDDPEYLKALCCLIMDPEIVSAVHDLVENDNLDTPLMQVEDDSAPVVKKPNCSEDSFSGPTSFELIARRAKYRQNQSPPISQNIHGSNSEGAKCGYNSPSNEYGVQNNTAFAPHRTTLSAASVFDVNTLISNAQRRAALMLGDSIKEKVLKAPLEMLPSLSVKFDELFIAIENNGVDASPLRNRVQKFMEDAAHFISIQSAYSEKISPDAQNQKLVNIRLRLADAITLESVEAQRINSLRADLVNAESRREALKKELEDLGIQIGQLHASISNSEVQLSHRQGDVSRIREEEDVIAKTPVLSDVDATTLRALQDILESQRSELKDLAWM